MCDPLLCDVSLFGVSSLEPRLLSPTPSGGAHYAYWSRHGSSSPMQQIVAKQIVGHHVLTSTQFNKEQVMMRSCDVIADHVLYLHIVVQTA